MNDTLRTVRTSEKGLILVLLVLGFFLFYYKAGDRYLWSPDEDEYALVNREMVEDGNWLYPTANGVPYSIKPPLYNWIGSGISVLAGGVSEYTSRLPSMLAAMAGVVLLYYLGRNLFGVRAGMLSALVLATSPLYIEFSRWIQVNMLSTVLLMATLLLFYAGYRSERKRPWCYLLMYVPAGVATLNMGPVSLVMPGLVISLYLAAVKDLRHLTKLRPGWGLLIYLGLAAPWYVLVGLKGGYLENLLIYTNFTRYFGDFDHARPLYYYFKTLPANFLPWTLFVPSAVVLCFSERAGEDKKKLLFPLVWAAVLFVFFSLSQTKRSEYLLPVIPALALLTGYTLDRAVLHWSEAVFWRRLVIWPSLVFVSAIGLFGLGLPVFCYIMDEDWVGIILPISVLCVAGGATVHILIKRNRVLASMSVIVVLVCCITVYIAGPMVGRVNDAKSARSFCHNITAWIEGNETLMAYNFYRPVYAYYTGKQVVNIVDTEDILKRLAMPEALNVIMREKDYLKIRERTTIALQVLHKQRIDHRYVVLVSNDA